MIQIRRSAIVPHTPAQMFDLVNDVEAYPKRFAWCAGAEVSERDDTHVVASLELRLAGMTQHFTTRNRLDRPQRIDMHFVDGPFRSLEGVWTFDALGEGGCKVQLALDFDYAGRLGGMALRLGLKTLADRMVDDFCREANRAHA